jgi:acetoin utilization deacetylase AcuC-like enzyme
MVFAAAELDDHATPAWHPEHKGRLDAALAGIDEAGLHDAATWRIPELATPEELSLAHDDTYVAAVEAFCAAGGGQLDPDTSATPGSWDTARRSAGAVLGAIDALRADECDVAFAAGRPPGHHAVRDRAMGFCLFNNAAVGAARLAAAGEKVAVVDWDVHHGNGTQDIFYNDPRVLYVSTHESPLYPGTGLLRERGAGAGEGTNLNLPFPAGTAGDTYRAAFDDVVVPVIERFAPDWLIISAGFDGHRNDPLAGCACRAPTTPTSPAASSAWSPRAGCSWCSRAATTSARWRTAPVPRSAHSWVSRTGRRRPPRARSGSPRSPRPSSSGTSDRCRRWSRGVDGAAVSFLVHPGHGAAESGCSGTVIGVALRRIGAGLRSLAPTRSGCDGAVGRSCSPRLRPYPRRHATER